MKRFTGIDPGVNKTAIVTIAETGDVSWEVVRVKREGPPKRRIDPARHWAMVSQVCDHVMGLPSPCVVAIEEPFVGANGATALLQFGVFASIVHELFPFFGGELRCLAPATLKKFVGVRGKKELMVREVFRRWEFDNDDTDVVDAYAMARWAMEGCGG